MTPLMSWSMRITAITNVVWGLLMLYASELMSGISALFIGSALLAMHRMLKKMEAARNEKQGVALPAGEVMGIITLGILNPQLVAQFEADTGINLVDFLFKIEGPPDLTPDAINAVQAWIVWNVDRHYGDEIQRRMQ